MTTKPKTMPQGTDEELVREALKAFNMLALSYRRGGLAYQRRLSEAALEAFEHHDWCERLVDPHRVQGRPCTEWTTTEEALRR